MPGLGTVHFSRRELARMMYDQARDSGLGRWEAFKVARWARRQHPDGITVSPVVVWPEDSTTPSEARIPV